MHNTTLCPSCNREILTGSYACQHCGQYLHSVRLARSRARSDNLYKIIPEGEQFAISFRGEVKVNGLNAEDLAQARGIVAILNSVIDEDEQVG